MKHSYILFYLTFSITSILSQPKNQNKIINVSGYHVWELRYDSLSAVHKVQKIFFVNSKTKKKYSIIRSEVLSYGVKLCDQIKNIIACISTKSVDNHWNRFYKVMRNIDSTVSNSNRVGGYFYLDKDKNVVIAYKITAKALVIDSLCSAYSNNATFNSVCGEVFSKPYICLVNINRSRQLKIYDRLLLKLTLSNFNEIQILDCF